MRKLFIHVGTEKTGTTTIQEDMYTNYNLLRKAGILYPKTFGISNHVGFCLAFMNYEQSSELYSVVGCRADESNVAAYKKKILKELEREIFESNCNTVVISNEHLHSRINSYGEVERIREWARNIFDEVEIVCYLRNQADLAVSYYSTLVKTGSCPDSVFPEFDKIPHYYDYRKLISMWEEVFGSIVVRKFERESLIDNDVTSDFLSIIGYGILKDKFHRDGNSNLSLDAAALELLKIVNKEYPFLYNGKVNPSRRYLVPFLEKVDLGLNFLPDLKSYCRFFDNFHIENLFLKEKYGISFSKKGFSGGSSGELNFNDAATVFSQVWSQCIEKINFLESRNLVLRAQVSFMQEDYAESLELLEKSKLLGFDLDLVKELKAKIEVALNT